MDSTKWDVFETQCINININIVTIAITVVIVLENGITQKLSSDFDYIVLWYGLGAWHRN